MGANDMMRGKMMAEYDLVVRDGQVIDGSGSTAVRADVAVNSGRISAIGRNLGRGRQEINAEGHVVTPGFIDGHTHMDAQLFWDSFGTPSVWHGVTTVVMGNCGFTIAPASSDNKHLVVRSIERAEDISGEAMAAGIDWTWSTFAEYLDAVDRRPKAINYAGYVGHSALRTWAMGERAFSETASEEDLAVMRRELTSALDAGAIGFSTSRTLHETMDDRPVASRLASWEEVVDLVGVLGQRGSGIFQLANEIAVGSSDPVIRQEASERLYQLAVSTRVPITFGVQPASSRHYLLDVAERAVRAGGAMFGQTHSRGICNVWSWATQTPFDQIPEWVELRSRPLGEQRQLLSDPAVRDLLVSATHYSNFGHSVGAEAPPPDYERLMLLDEPLPPHQTIADIARSEGLDPVEFIIQRGVETDFAQFYLQPLVPDTEDDLLTAMRHPLSVMTFSDSGAHVSQIVDSSIHTHLLGYWVRQRGIMTLEEAVRMITSVPASAFGFTDRGLVKEGLVADLNIIDPDTIGPAMPEIGHDLPSGACRLKQKSYGILATIVSGQIVTRDAEPTGSTPGHLLRGPFARSQMPSA